MEFRGTPFMASDVSSASVAINVLDSYHIAPYGALIFTGILLILIFAYIIFVEQKKARGCIANVDIQIAKEGLSKTPRKYVTCNLFVALIALILSFCWVVYADWTKVFGMQFSWYPANEYQEYGFMTSFILSGKNMRIDPPDGYSEEKVMDIINGIDGVEHNEVENAALKPTIIGIMNEAFSDLSIYGSSLDNSSDLTFFNSLKDDPGTIEFGWNYVSVYGGLTSETEFELLTGNSMRLIRDVAPYNTYNFSRIQNMADLMKVSGYDTWAFHPSFGMNYKRNSVYNQMGFDDFMTSNDMDGTGVVRGYYSDWRDYDYLIYWQRGHAGETPQFIFNVTIQNHGGYSLQEIEGSGLPVSKVNGQYSKYEDLIAYESLLYQSDRALEYLISYYREVDEPVIVFFFGDHQPRLSSSLIKGLTDEGSGTHDSAFEDDQKMYAVPYFIWSNYDVSTPNKEIYRDQNDMTITSTIYLGVSVEQYAGIETSAYGNYLLNMRNNIPAINSYGYMDRNGAWHAFDDENTDGDTDDYACELISNYNILEYANMFEPGKYGDLLR